MSSKRVLLSVGAVLGLFSILGAMSFANDNPESTRDRSVLGGTNEVLSVTKTSKPKSSKKSKSSLAPPTTIKARPGNKLVWQQDFTVQPDGRPDAKYWNIATTDMPIYNDEAQVYLPSANNVRVAGGTLVLEAHQAPKGYSSGRIDTKGKVSVEAGSRLEARIKLPQGRGTWPAFWLLSANQPHSTKLRPTEADWQATRFYMWDGEIDIMESYGTYPGVVEATVHTFGRSQEKQQRISKGFHNYWLEWREDKLVFGVDDMIYSTYDKYGGTDTWPFTKDNKMYIILNLAMGGSGGGKIEQQSDDIWRMEVESIKYYRL